MLSRSAASQGGLPAPAAAWQRSGVSGGFSIQDLLQRRGAEILGWAWRPGRKAGFFFPASEMAFAITEKLITGEITERNILPI